MTYIGNGPIVGLTNTQVAACEAAAKMAPPDWHDGILRAVAAQLGDSPSWSDAEVLAAIKTVLDNLGLTNPLDLGA
jgi:hypothetical protein